MTSDPPTDPATPRHPSDSLETESPGASPSHEASPRARTGTGFHPAYGCIIGVTILVMVAGFLSWCTYVGTQQEKAIALFTEEQATPTKIAELSQEEAELIQQRLGKYTDAALAYEETSIRLDVDDLNAMIASLPRLQEYRGMVFFREIRADGSIIADLCHPLRSRTSPTGERFVVGEGTFQLRRQDNNLHTWIDQVEVADKTVSEGYLRNFRRYLWLIPFQEDNDENARIAPVLERTQFIDFEKGAFTLSTDPRERRKDAERKSTTEAP